MNQKAVQGMYNYFKLRYCRSNVLAKIMSGVCVSHYGKWEYIDSSYLWQSEFYFCSWNGKLLYSFLPKSYTMYILWPYDNSTDCVETLKSYATVINAFTNYLNAHDMHVIKYLRMDNSR